MKIAQRDRWIEVDFGAVFAGEDTADVVREYIVVEDMGLFVGVVG